MEPFVREEIPLDPKDVGWVDGELRRQVASRAIEDATCLDYVAPAFVVVQASGKRRVVVDFDKLNKETLKSAFRYETLKSLRHLAKRGDWAISFDLEDGFHAIPIHPDDRKYFTFSIGGKVFQFAALPFGWTLSPYVFTKVMRPVVRFFRSHNGVGLPSEAISRLPRVPWRGAQVEDPGNVRCLPYMDDFLFLFATRELARMGAAFIDATLTALGLKRSIKKSVWEPTQRLQHLGLLVDFQRGLFLVPPVAVKSIQQQAKQLLISATDTTARVAVRRLAAFAGKVASVDLACPLARFRTRAIHDCIAVAPHWEAHVRLSRAARTDLGWWVHFDVQAQERAIWQAPCTRVLHADASGEIGWGAVLDSTVPASGFWRSHQQHEHITLKELRAVRYAVESFMPELANHIVQLHEDNQAVVAILMSGTSRSPQLMRELRKLFDICGLRNITLRPQYIRSHLNVLADRLSRLKDHDDWKLNPRIFREAAAKWGVPQVDRFATANNAQCERFNSRWGDPRSEARDAFTQVWAGTHSWLNPPWGCIGRVLAKVRCEGAEASVVVPFWSSQTWYPELLELADDIVYYAPEYDLFLPGDTGSSKAVGPPRWGILVAHIPQRSGTGEGQQ